MSIAIKKALGYALFLLVVGCFFLYIFFPTDSLRQYVEASMGKISPSLSLDVGRIRPALPFGIALEKVRLHHESEPRIPVFAGDTVTLFPSLRTLMERKPIVRFSCNTYGGNLDGRVVFRSFGLTEPLESHVRITDILLQEYGFLTESLKRQCTGVINGTVSYAFDKSDRLAGSGKADLSISDGAVPFNQPLFGLEILDFERLNARMELKERQLVFEEISFRGKQLEARGNGTMRLDEMLGRSRLNLSIRVSPMPALWETAQDGFTVAQLFKQQPGSSPFNVRIYGTVAQPRIRLP